LKDKETHAGILVSYVVSYKESEKKKFVINSACTPLHRVCSKPMIKTFRHATKHCGLFVSYTEIWVTFCHRHQQGGEYPLKIPREQSSHAVFCIFLFSFT
jgi:hypothetical protein